MDAPVKVACIQAEPVVLDREATIDKLERPRRRGGRDRRAAARLPRGVRPGLPVLGLGEGARRLGRARRDRGVRTPRPRVGRRARRGRGADRRGGAGNGVWIVTGVTEVDPERPSTLYNTLLYHAPDGTLALKHRKLVPTNHERLIWGQGDGEGLRAIPTTARTARRPDLLGELHAARAVRALRVRRRDLHRLDRRRRRLPGRRRSCTSPASRARSSSPPPTSSEPPPTRTTSRSRRLIEGAGIDRPRRLGDPRARRLLSRRPAVRRGGHPLRRARPGSSLGRAAALRPRRPLPPARRARASGSPRSSREQRRRRRRRRLRRLDRTRARAPRLGRDARRAVHARQRALGLRRRHAPAALLARRPGVVHAAARAGPRALARARARLGADALRAGRGRVVRHRRERLHRPERGRR